MFLVDLFAVLHSWALLFEQSLEQNVKRCYKIFGDRSFVRMVRGCNPLIAFVVSDAISTRQRRLTCPKKSMVLEKNRHFFSLSGTLAFHRSVSTLRTWLICCCGDLEKMTISSKYMKAIFHRKLKKVTSVVRWNVQGVLRFPNSMRLNQYIT